MNKNRKSTLSTVPLQRIYMRALIFFFFFPLHLNAGWTPSLTSKVQVLRGSYGTRKKYEKKKIVGVVKW